MSSITDLPNIPSTLSSRKKRSEKVIAGKSHCLYNENMELCGNQTYLQFTSNKIGIPTGDDPLHPQVVFCNDPVEASRMLRNHVGKASFPYSEVLAGNGVLGQTDPAAWRRQRDCLRPGFRTAEVEHLLDLMHEYTTLYVIYPLLKLKNKKNTNIYVFLLKSSFNLIGNVVLGGHSEWLKEHGASLRKAFEAGLQPLFKDTTIGQEAYRIMTEFAYHAWEFARTRRNENPSVSVSIVDRLLQNEQLSPEQRQDELMTIMFAGHETTANTLAWCLYELSRSTDIQDKLRHELFHTLKSQKRATPSQLSFSTLNKLKYLSAALRETMRLWPVVSNGTFRVISDNNKRTLSNNIEIPVGTAFQVPHWAFHRNKQIWGETADIFDIDRYQTNWNHDAFMPFSKPPRDCLGRHFAMASMRVTLVQLLYYFKFSYPVDAPPKKGKNWAMLQPEDGLELHLETYVESKL